MTVIRALHVDTRAGRSSTVGLPNLRMVCTQRGRASSVVFGALMMMGAAVLLIAPGAYAAQAPVGLGTADSFAVLAGSGVTNTGATTITGDVGTFPTPSETGFGSVSLSGTNHAGDAVTQGAKNDLVVAYNDAAARHPVTSLPVELGGSTLLAGVYTSPTFGLTGTLTLDAQGNTNAEFIFQAGSTVITASDSRVLLLNGADPCHVVWQVGSSATFNTGTTFIGDVLAQTSITAQTGATFQGRLLARDGAVTLDHNTITRAGCVAPASPGGTTATTVGTTATTRPTPPVTAVGGVSSPIPGAAPGASASGAVPFGAPGPGLPTATPASPSLSPAPPAATPGVASGPPTKTTAGPPSGFPGTPSGPPFLARTGMPVMGSVVAGLALLALGATGVIVGRRRQKSAAR